MKKVTLFIASLAMVLGMFLPAASAQSIQLVYSNRAEACRVDAAYNILLGRKPDPSGFNYWFGLINAGSVNGTQVIQTHIPATWEYTHSPTSGLLPNINIFIDKLYAWGKGTGATGAQRTFYTNYINAYGRHKAVGYFMAFEPGNRCVAANLAHPSVPYKVKF